MLNRLLLLLLLLMVAIPASSPPAGRPDAGSAITVGSARLSEAAACSLPLPAASPLEQLGELAGSNLPAPVFRQAIALFPTVSSCRRLLPADEQGRRNLRWVPLTARPPPLS